MYPLTLLHYPAVTIKSECPEEECNWLATKTGHGPNCMYQYKIRKKKCVTRPPFVPFSIEKTFTTMFWAMFGMGESSVVKLGDSYNGGFTERIGYIVFGAYNIAIVVILLNMLIAMMSRSFEAIAVSFSHYFFTIRSEYYLI